MQKTIEERFNLEAENQVLGSFFLENSLIKQCKLPAAAISEGHNRNLFLTLKDMDDKGIPVDPFTVAQRIGMDNLFKVGGISNISEIASSVPSTKNFEYYEQMIMEKYKEQETAMVGKQLEHGMDPEAAMNQLRKLQELGQKRKRRTTQDILVETYDKLERADGRIRGATTGYRDLDRMFKGLKGGTFMVIGARPSVGKTAFAINVGQNAAKGPENMNGSLVEIYSYEMDDVSLAERMIGATGNIDLSLMETAQRDFQGSDWTKLTHAMGTIGSTQIGIVEAAGLGTADIRADVRAMREKNPTEEIMIIVDYLQLVSGDPKLAKNREQQVSDISRQMKLIAMEFNAVVIALSQLSRGLEQRQDKRPMMSDLRESGSIEQDADIIAFLYRDDYYDKETEDQNMIEIIIAKQRNGPTGTVKLAFVKEYGKFVTIDWSNHQSE